MHKKASSLYVSLEAKIDHELVPCFIQNLGIAIVRAVARLYTLQTLHVRLCAVICLSGHLQEGSIFQKVCPVTLYLHKRLTPAKTGANPGRTDAAKCLPALELDLARTSDVP